MIATDPLVRRSRSWLAAVLAAGASLGGCGGGDGERNVRFCAVTEGSRSTRVAEIRNAYLNAFAKDVEWFAEQPGDVPMCLILAIGNPTINQIAELAIRAEDEHSADADAEVATNVETAKAQFAQVLANARDTEGTPILEALYALAERADIQPGDTISVYSDMRQHSPNIRTYNLVRISDTARQAELVSQAIEQLRAAGLLPDGQDGRPSLADVHIVVPEPSASARISEPEDRRVEAARQVVAKQFWTEWADAVGADLRWGGSAGAVRRADAGG